MYVLTDTTGRIGATSATHHLGDAEFEFEVPCDFDFSRQHDWLIVDGVLVHDPLPEPVLVPTVEQRVAAVEQTQDDLVVMLADMIGGGR